MGFGGGLGGRSQVHLAEVRNVLSSPNHSRVETLHAQPRCPVSFFLICLHIICHPISEIQVSTSGFWSVGALSAPKPDGASSRLAAKAFPVCGDGSIRLAFPCAPGWFPRGLSAPIEVLHPEQGPTTS